MEREFQQRIEGNYFYAENRKKRMQAGALAESSGVGKEKLGPLWPEEGNPLTYISTLNHQKKGDIIQGSGEFLKAN